MSHRATRSSRALFPAVTAAAPRALLPAVTSAIPRALLPAVTSAISLALASALILFAPACDGTVTGIARVPLPPETPLAPAPVESARARTPGASNRPGTESAGQPAPSEPETVGSTGKRTIAAQHLLVMYTGSKAAPATLQRTREQARTRAEEALRRVRAGEDFGALVGEYTDEPGGAKRHGDLGLFTPEQMVRPFSDAAFALEVGQVSGVVETPFGFHVIKRTE